MPTRTEIIDMQHQKMGKLQRRFSKYGASDTDPDYHYRNAIGKAILGEPFIPLTSSQWELYDDPGVQKAVDALNNHTSNMVKFILDTPIADLPDLEKWAFQTLAGCLLDRRELTSQLTMAYLVA